LSKRSPDERSDIRGMVLLSGGDKSSQRRDIARAKRMARELKESG
jgi:putative component of toxin-antitoxin plasmid stabilization module